MYRLPHIRDRTLLSLIVILVVGFLTIIYYSIPYPNNIMLGYKSNIHNIVKAEKTVFFILLTYILTLVWYFMFPSRTNRLIMLILSLTYIVFHYVFYTINHYSFTLILPFLTKLSKNGHEIIIFDWSHLAIITLIYSILREFRGLKRLKIKISSP